MTEIMTNKSGRGKRVDKLLAELEQFIDKHGRKPTKEDTECGGDLTFHRTEYRNYFGSFENALEDLGVKNPHINGKRQKSQYRGRNWRRQRLKAVKRDNRQCRVCSMSHDEHESQYGRGLEVHHISPYRTFADESYDCGYDYQAANELTNLITLCHDCHKKVDGRWREMSVDEFAQRAKIEVEEDD